MTATAWPQTLDRIRATVENSSHVQRGLRYQDDVAELVTEVERLRRDNAALTENVTSVQERCTELLLETREIRPLLAALSRAREKHPRGCNYVALVEEVGEVARALRREGADRVREECVACRGHYRNWSDKTPAEKRHAPRPRTGTGQRVVFQAVSKNRKLGPIPSCIVDEASCPTTCPLQGAGCYAEFHHLGKRWRAAAANGMLWDEFCARVAELPDGQLWRYGEAGDLPGAGFTINLSADSLREADEKAALGIGPVAVVLPHDAALHASRTPGGRKVVVCPAQTHHMTCAECQLCAWSTRKSIVGFVAHGQAKKLVTDLVRRRAQ